MQTMTINGEKIPVIVSSTYLVDLGPLPAADRPVWLARFRAALRESGAEIWQLPVPVDLVASGRYGRTVLRIWAPDPDRALFAAEGRMDGAPKVVAL
jgi:hypothetical protein